MFKASFSPFLVLIAAMLLPATATAEEVPISINADNGQYDRNRGITHLVGNVRITRGEMTVHADEGYAYSDGDGYRRAELFGQPATWRATTEDGGEIHGEADEIHYDVVANHITLIGDARIEDAQGNLRGQRLIYDLDAESISGEGGVEMTIQPDAQPQD